MVKFVRRDLTLWGNISQDYSTRNGQIADEIAAMIVSTDTGWEYDSRTPVGTHIDIPSKSTSGSAPRYIYPAVYLRNSESGAKMMIFCNTLKESNISNDYFPWITNGNYAYANKQYSNNVIEQWSNSYNYKPLGVVIAMIPAGSTSEFPNSIAGSDSEIWMPSDAVSLFPEGVGEDNRSTAWGNATNNMIVSYGLLVDSEFVCVLSSWTTSSTRSQLYIRYAVGKIFGTLAHESDSLITSQYGAINFRYGQTENTFIRITHGLNGTNYYFQGNNLTAPTPDSSTGYTNIFMFSANGTRLSAYAYYSTVSWETLDPTIMNDITGTTRWCPFVATTKFYPDTLYVVPGDGFKGYLDTNLFRNALCTKGNYYNNGAFVALDNNLLVAWDSDATDNIM